MRRFHKQSSYKSNEFENKIWSEALLLFNYEVCLYSYGNVNDWFIVITMSNNFNPTRIYMAMRCENGTVSF